MTNTYTYIYTHIYTYIYAYVNIHTHTYTYLHICTHMYRYIALLCIALLCRAGESSAGGPGNLGGGFPREPGRAPPRTSYRLLWDPVRTITGKPNWGNMAFLAVALEASLLKL